MLHYFSSLFPKETSFCCIYICWQSTRTWFYAYLLMCCQNLWTEPSCTLMLTLCRTRTNPIVSLQMTGCMRDQATSTSWETLLILRLRSSSTTMCPWGSLYTAASPLFHLMQTAVPDMLSSSPGELVWSAPWFCSQRWTSIVTHALCVCVCVFVCLQVLDWCFCHTLIISVHGSQIWKCTSVPVGGLPVPACWQWTGEHFQLNIFG